MTTDVLLVLSLGEALLLVLILALSLTTIHDLLEEIADGLTTLGSALSSVESGHLRPLGPAVVAINGQFDRIIGLMPGVASKAAIVASHVEKEDEK
jgi:hypothetical protein